jgi:hypothetical protein
MDSRKTGLEPSHSLVLRYSQPSFWLLYVLTEHLLEEWMTE